MKNITVIGSGSWGTALACLLDDNGHNVTMWAYKTSEVSEILNFKENRLFLPGIILAETIKVTNDIDLCTQDANIFVLAVPSNHVRSTMSLFKSYLKDSDIIINVSKGLDEEKLLRLSEVIEEITPKCKVAVLSGPSHAEEVGNKLVTTCVVSSKHEEVSKIVQSIFMNNYFRVYTNDDLIGVELGGALKNVIALAAGIADGLGFGDNTKAALMTRGIAEISRLGVAMGANAITFNGLSGVGDLIVTCTSMHSRNRRAGILIGQGKSLDDTLSEIKMVVEGVNTARAAYNFSVKYNVSMPITEQIYEVLFNKKDARIAVMDLMTRDKTSENEQ
jgi:glycerol-3-phosphate dehydrogenase (NAD(P)+)